MRVREERNAQCAAFLGAGGWLAAGLRVVHAVRAVPAPLPAVLAFAGGATGLLWPSALAPSAAPAVPDVLPLVRRPDPSTPSPGAAAVGLNGEEGAQPLCVLP